jgi:hypothetical protein
MKEQPTVQTELNDIIHQQILDGATRRFPLESYQRLVATGTSPELALRMLGWDRSDPLVPADL